MAISILKIKCTIGNMPRLFCDESLHKISTSTMFYRRPSEDRARACSAGYQAPRRPREHSFPEARTALPTQRRARRLSGHSLAIARRIASPSRRLIRPSLCSRSTGFDGRFQCTMSRQKRWKSSPSCPTDVVDSTNGQNGELKASRTAVFRLGPDCSSGAP